MIKFLNFLSLILYCTLIYWLSDRPTLPMPMLFAHQDKLHHATAYFVMAVLAWRSFKAYIKRPIILVLMSIVFCSLYGISDEWHQSFVKGRVADTADWLADTLGAILAGLMMYKFFKP
ncbi:MAG: VanZ family protein [Methylococcaceae bacterium]|nr:VanZ family protein [Methylococcaceae bacterium]